MKLMNILLASCILASTCAPIKANPTITSTASKNIIFALNLAGFVCGLGTLATASAVHKTLLEQQEEDTNKRKRSWAHNIPFVEKLFNNTALLYIMPVYVSGTVVTFEAFRNMLNQLNA